MHERKFDNENFVAAPFGDGVKSSSSSNRCQLIQVGSLASSSWHQSMSCAHAFHGGATHADRTPVRPSPSSHSESAPARACPWRICARRMPPLWRELLQRRLQRCPMNIANEATLRARLPGGIALGFVILSLSSPGSQAWESGSGGSRALPLRPHLRRLDHTMSAAISAAASWSAMKTIRRRAVSTSALTSACHVRNTAATNGRPLCPRDGAVARDSAAAVRRRAQLWCKLRALPPMNRLQRSPCALTRGRGDVDETVNETVNETEEV